MKKGVRGLVEGPRGVERPVCCTDDSRVGKSGIGGTDLEARPVRADHGGTFPMRVMIVDDQAPFREAARELLEARGYVVVADVEDGSDALAEAARLTPDAVLLDVRLGSQNGLDLAQALTRAQPGLAVLLVSATGQDASAERVRACGARGLLRKDQLVFADLEAFWRDE
jgi:CheY-like chemotaxis protein